jgi:hypothetical protein
MKRVSIKRAGFYLLLFIATIPLGAYSLEFCGSTPVRPLPHPIVLRPNGCSFKDLSSPTGRSLAILSREGDHGWTTQVLPPNVGDPCFVTTGDNSWDVGLVSPGTIDGSAGRTLELYEGCPDSRKHEADIFVAVGVDFNQADQRRFARTGSVGIGRHAMLHEYGHAVGLEHDDDAFGLMRSTTALGAPMGGHNNSGSPHYFMADDYEGLFRIRGSLARNPNFYVTSQVVLNGGALRNASDNPFTGTPMPDPLAVHTGDIIFFNAGAGVHDWFGRKIELRAYADSSTECTSLPGVGVTLGVATMLMPFFATGSGVMNVKIPPLGPSGQILNVHLAGTLIPTPQDTSSEKRGWDDCATTALRLKAP